MSGKLVSLSKKSYFGSRSHARHCFVGYVELPTKLDGITICQPMKLRVVAVAFGTTIEDD